MVKFARLINDDECILCGNCLGICDYTITGDCIGCGNCINECPMDCIELVEVED